MQKDLKQEHYEDMPDSVSNEMMNLKKARLIEDKMTFEDLAVIENFSEDEVTFALSRLIIKERKDKSAL